MYMKKSTILLSCTVLTVILIGVVLAYYYIFEFPKRSIAERCAGYIPYWETFIDCSGVITITDAWDTNYISIDDHLHGYQIAEIYNLNQITQKNQKMYVINHAISYGYSTNGVETVYYQQLFQNGRVNRNRYNNVSEIPTYLIIDSNSGEVNAFQNINQVPESEQTYFHEIKDK
jgi:hypothetical protein